MLPAGSSWCLQFPTSTSLDDLIEPFQTNCRAFINALETKGAKIVISATYRPLERAALMHYCCMIGQGKMDPASVPTITGVDIQWVLDTPTDSILAAKDMMKGYDIVYPPALVSRHTQRLAIDMTIINGLAAVGTLEPGQSLLDGLIGLGKTFNVIKLPLNVLDDPPHWSSDGH